MMKFRQRIAWILLTAFLSGSVGFVYYVFEINEHFNTLALEHVQTQHNGDTKAGTFLDHMTHLPLAVWMLIFLLPYLQIFALLLACTRPEPRMSLAYIWPSQLFVRSRRLLRRYHPHDSKSINSGIVFYGRGVILEA